MTDVALGGGDLRGLQIIDPVLSNVAVQYRPGGFIYDQLVNSFPVEYNNGQYPFFDMAAFFASGEGRPIADNDATPIVDFKAEERFYHCRDYRKSIRITRKEYQQANPALRIETSKILGLLSQFAGEREIRLANKLKAEGSGGEFTTAAIEPEVKWDKGTTVTPATIQATLQEAMRTVRNKTGVWPNTLVITRDMAQAISIDPTLRELIKYQMGREQLEQGDRIVPARLFGLNVIEADSPLTNTASSGKTPALKQIWGNSARVLYVNNAPAWGMPTICYGFRGKVQEGFDYQTPAVAPGGISQQEPGAATQWTVVDRWSEVDPPANRIRVWECVDEHLVAPELGVEIKNVLEVE